MAVKFQSEEFFQQVNAALKSNEAVQSAARGKNVRVQIVTSNAPGEGEIKTFLKITDGVTEVGRGEVESPDATISQDYATATALDKGELNAQNAFMQGKIKIKGNLMKMMQLQGFLQAVAPATAQIEREY